MVQGFGQGYSAEAPPSPSSALSPASDFGKVEAQLLSHFSELDDPRGAQGVLHPFISIVMIALLATIGGAQGWEDIEVYGESHQRWLSDFLSLPFGIPSADTYRRLFERIAPSALERSFHSWLGSLVTELGAEVVAIDGKSVNGSYDRERAQSSLHLVSAWASEHRLFLGQVKVEGKSNEITAIPSLLALLDISGCIITLDAMGTQHRIARQIVERGADYVLALKANHPTLFNQVVEWFEEADSKEFDGIDYTFDERVESGHHRTEKRQIWAVSLKQMGELYKQDQWQGLQTLIKVVRTRRLWNKTTRETMYYLSSLPPQATVLGKAIRQHWSIENQLHWVLDVTFNEDASRIRTAHAPQNMALLKRWSLNLLNQETSTKRSIRQKARRASMNEDYMIKVLQAAKPASSSTSDV